MIKSLECSVSNPRPSLFQCVFCAPGSVKFQEHRATLEISLDMDHADEGQAITELSATCWS